DEVPVPDGGVEPAGEGDDPLGSVPDPGLRVLDAEVLLEVPVRVLDGPAVGVEARHLCGRHGGIGGDEEVVVLVAGGIADDDEQVGSGAGGLIPQDQAGPELALDHLAAAADLAGGRAGVGAGGGQAERRGQALALGAGPTTAAG